MRVLACVRACLCVCVCVCVSFASYSSETIEIIIIKLATVGETMHHVLIIMTLTFIQGQIDFNHDNRKCSIISETVQAMPVTFAVKIGRLKVYIIVS